MNPDKVFCKFLQKRFLSLRIHNNVGKAFHNFRKICSGKYKNYKQYKDAEGTDTHEEKASNIENLKLLPAFSPLSLPQPHSCANNSVNKKQNNCIRIRQNCTGGKQTTQECISNRPLFCGCQSYQRQQYKSKCQCIIRKTVDIIWCGHKIKQCW